MNKILDKMAYCGEAKSFWGPVFCMQDGARVWMTFVKEIFFQDRPLVIKNWAKWQNLTFKSARHPFGSIMWNFNKNRYWSEAKSFWGPVFCMQDVAWVWITFRKEKKSRIDIWSPKIELSDKIWLLRVRATVLNNILKFQQKSILNLSDKVLNFWFLSVGPDKSLIYFGSSTFIRIISCSKANGER